MNIREVRQEAGNRAAGPSWNQRYRAPLKGGLGVNTERMRGRNFGPQPERSRGSNSLQGMRFKAEQ